MRMQRLSESAISARRLVPAAALALTAGLLAVPGAQAEPEVTEKQVEALFHEAETMNEQVNAISESIKDTEQQIDDLTDDVSAQQKVYDRQRATLAELTVQEQIEAPLGTTASLLGSGDSDQFLEGLGAVQALNSSRTDALEAFSTASAELKNRRAQLDERLDELAADKKAANKKRKAVAAKHAEAKDELEKMSAAAQADFNKSDTTVDFDVNAKGAAKKAIAFAMDQLGDPYVYGGTGPDGWDCSGLVQGAYKAAGVSLPRVVGPQMSAVKRVSMDSLQPGDLVAYGDMSHNGIYIGGGKVIHAPRPGKSVEITSLSGFTVAGRVG